MATAAEIKAQLTGPGGPFEVTTDVVNGIELQVYKERMKSLRQVAEIAHGRGNDQQFIVYGDRRIGFGDFVELSNAVGHHLRDDFGVAHGDRVAVLSANNPEWCMTFWGTVN